MNNKLKNKTRLSVAIPVKLKERLKVLADQNNRSLTKEIINRLEKTLNEEKLKG